MSRFEEGITRRVIRKAPTFEVNQYLPINLLRKAVRERRIAWALDDIRDQKTKRHKRRRPSTAHAQLLQSSEEAIQKILRESDVLSDVEYYGPAELSGEIALERGTATTVHIERDGLATLNIVLPQASPTIANLKRAIESTSRAQLERRLRERHVERLQRRQLLVGPHESAAAQAKETVSAAPRRQQAARRVEEATTTATVPFIKSTGELVYSTACSGHHHRSCVSWRYLWRAFALYDPSVKKPIDDAHGRKLLIDCGIHDGSVLKFCNREKYFGRKRQ